MRWPWVSACRLDDALSQVEWLRAQNDQLREALTRMGRASHGMPEVPRQPRPAMEKMPDELVLHFAGYGNAELGRFNRNAAYRANAQGESWDSIMVRIFEPQEVDLGSDRE